MSTTEPIRSKKQIQQLAEYYLKKGHLRNYLLVILGVSTALRISDLLQLTWDDVYDYEQQKMQSHIYVTEQKTDKQKCIALNAKTRSALLLVFKSRNPNSDSFLFQSQRIKKAPIGRVQAWRIIKSAALEIGLSSRIACHSMRKTFGYHAWKSGVSAVLLMNIYNHSNYAITRRYLGISQDDLDCVYLNMDLF